MRIAPSITVVATDLEANQVITDDKSRRWIIDYVVKRSDKVEAACYPEGRTVQKRTVFEYKLTETVTVQVAPEVGKGILDVLIESLAASPACQEKNERTPAELTITSHGEGYMLAGSKPQQWQLVLEP